MCKKNFCTGLNGRPNLFVVRSIGVQDLYQIKLNNSPSCRPSMYMTYIRDLFLNKMFYYIQ